MAASVIASVANGLIAGASAVGVTVGVAGATVAYSVASVVFYAAVIAASPAYGVSQQRAASLRPAMATGLSPHHDGCVGGMA